MAWRHGCGISGENLFFPRVRPGNVSGALEEVKRQPFVQEVKTVMGPYEFAFSRRFKDVNELNRFVQLLKAKEYCEECVVNPTFDSWEEKTTEEKPIVAWSLIQATYPSEVQEKLKRVEGAGGSTPRQGSTTWWPTWGSMTSRR